MPVLPEFIAVESRADPPPDPPPGFAEAVDGWVVDGETRARLLWEAVNRFGQVQDTANTRARVGEFVLGRMQALERGGSARRKP